MVISMFNIRNARAVLVVAALARPALAQISATDASEAKPSPFITRSAFSVTFTQIRPQGAFGKNIGLGYGASGAYLFRIDRAGVLSVRTDIGAADYGDESKRTALSETVGGRVQVNVRTSNYIIP